MKPEPGSNGSDFFGLLEGRTRLAEGADIGARPLLLAYRIADEVERKMSER